VSGTTRWFRGRAVSASELAVSAPAAVTSIAVVARSGNAASPLGAPSVVQQDGQVLVANGRLQNELVSPRWDLTGFDGPFAVFSDRFASGLLTIKALPGQSASGASVRYLSGGPDDPLAAAVSSAHGIRLVRSVAAIPGWDATWQPATGPAVALPVRADGLVQVVDVPAGRGTVTWRYTSPHFVAGLALSLAAALLVLLLALASGRPGLISWVPRWRILRGGRGRGPGSGSGQPGDWDDELAEEPPLEVADVLHVLVFDVLEWPQKTVSLDRIATYPAYRLDWIVADVEEIGLASVRRADGPGRRFRRVEANHGLHCTHQRSPSRYSDCRF
jgi:hypothetical protein